MSHSAITYCHSMVPHIRFELIHLSVQEPKSCVSANFTNAALMVASIGIEPILTVSKAVVLPNTPTRNIL